jgi:glycerol-3-phosphate cytidylyltransferase-like family protein
MKLEDHCFDTSLALATGAIIHDIFSFVHFFHSLFLLASMKLFPTLLIISIFLSVSAKLRKKVPIQDPKRVQDIKKRTKWFQWFSKSKDKTTGEKLIAARIKECSGAAC